MEWSLDALADLDRFATFLHDQHPDLARRVAHALITRAEVLRWHPKLGRSFATRGDPGTLQVPGTGAPGARWRVRPAVSIRWQRRADAALSVSQLVRRALDQDELLTSLSSARAELQPQARAQGIYTDEDVFAIVS